MIGRPRKYPIRKKRKPAEDPSGHQLPDLHLTGLELSPEISLGTETPAVDTVHLDTASADTANADVAVSDSLVAPENEDLFTEPPALFLPAIPIEPTKPIHIPPSWSLPSGDALIDAARNPLPDGPNPSIFRPRSASAHRDRFSQALHPDAFASNETHMSAESLASDPASAPDFPITPFAPFIALPHPDFASGGTAPAATQEAQSGQELDSADSHVAPAQVDSATTDIVPQGFHPAATPFSIAPPDFRLEPEPDSRIPNLGHLLILAVIALLGFVAAGLAVQIAFRSHLWGVKTIDQATTDIHYTLASMAVLYVVSFALAFFLFPLLWHKPFFAALQWNARAALRQVWLLFAAAGFCFVLAIIDEWILPGPNNAPIDKMFSNTAAAWLLFAFGVTVAPFFEEMTFRGFLLPALCTAVDWAISKRNEEPMLPLGPNGHPQWSLAAMIVGSLLTSLPFAAMHADQIAHSVGPLLLLYCVSLVLCFTRLITRSLAASTFVHASYNLLLFSLMLWGTDGFKHLDKM